MPKRFPALLLTVTALTVGACGSTGGVDPTPEKKDGAESHQFEQDDIDRANGATDAVKEYCSGAVSEAQRVGCESHVDDSDMP